MAPDGLPVLNAAIADTYDHIAALMATRDPHGRDTGLDAQLAQLRDHLCLLEHEAGAAIRARGASPPSAALVAGLALLARAETLRVTYGPRAPCSGSPRAE